MIERTESGMNFCFEENYYYSIEEEGFYDRITSKYGAKVCDFIVLREEKLLLIEAKSSAPKNSKELNRYVSDIYQKYIDSLIIYIAAIHNRKNTRSDSLATEMKKTSNLKKEIMLVLIINGFPKAYLQDIKNIFDQFFRKLNYIFSISGFILMNDQQARSRGFIK